MRHRHITRSVLSVVLLFTLSGASLVGQGAKSPPRTGTEALALRILQSYRDSLAKQAVHEQARASFRQLIQEVAPAGLGAAAAVPMEDVAMLNRANEEIEREIAWRKILVEFWNRNRSEVADAPRTFTWRYGALEGPNQIDLDLVARNIQNFPFLDPKSAAKPATTAPPDAAPTASLEGLWDTSIPGSVHVQLDFRRGGAWTLRFFGFKGWEQMADVKVNEATGDISWRRPLAWAGEGDQLYTAKVSGTSMTGSFNGTWSGTKAK